MIAVGSLLLVMSLRFRSQLKKSNSQIF